ncbi:hypothetical protein SDJN02_02106, partial [Cucurbita argyrosperma subsp. argyrosperma]
FPKGKSPEARNICCTLQVLSPHSAAIRSIGRRSSTENSLLSPLAPNERCFQSSALISNSGEYVVVEHSK